MDALKYVWYACFGSNLNRERFMCYIQGGTPKNSTRKEIGCIDKTPPKKDTPYRIPRPLYFAKNAPHWNNGGAGFLGLKPDNENFTYSRKYLITTNQFVELVRQENKRFDIDVNFEQVIADGSAVVTDSRYGNLMYLGEEEGYPVFTFTINEEMGTSPFVKPDIVYLKVLVSGLKEIFHFSDIEYVEYLLKKPGIKGNYSWEELMETLFV